ncbi:MAG: energy transducer TonB [Bacteroidales bacterium]|nr:energy transducer TonB [Bacteroidales bacterium]
MKKILSLVILATLSFANCFSQIKTPVQADTLVIKSMQYHSEKIRPGNFPFKYVIRTSTSVIFGDQEFKIKKIRDHGAQKDILLKYGKKSETLTMADNGNSISVMFDGYVLGCCKPERKSEKRVSYSENRVSYKDVDEKPSFRGGNANDFARWVNEQLEYPKSAKKNGIQGRVMVGFTVDTNGRVIDAKILRGAHPDLDAEALRVVNSSPKWKPGKKNGTPVEVTFTFPVIFGLNDD